MKRICYIAAVVAVCLICPTLLRAMDLINTSRPENIIVVGVRAGFNTSNLTNNYHSQFSGIASQKQQWRNGLTVGAVADINFTGYLTIQPGIYLSTRKNEYSILTDNTGFFELYNGKASCNYLTVPFLASFRMGVAELIQLQIDLGPYFAWGFGGKNRFTRFGYNEVGMPKIFHSKADYFGDGGLAKRYDYGLKTGLGILAMGKFYIGAHYMYGCRNILQPVPLTDKQLKGHNKRWEFTIGYNL